MSPDILLHVCCASCLARTRRGWRDAGENPDRMRGWFHNPNIHPLIEFRRRIKALAVYRARDPMPFELDERYGVADFLAWQGAPAAPSGGNGGANDTAGIGGFAARGAADADFPPPYGRPGRCLRCYARRLGAAARLARRLGFAAFMTTLQSSREQDHTALREAGERAGREAGVRFLYLDCRAAEPDESLLRGVYKQGYCGCVFSEADRYAPTRLHLVHENGQPFPRNGVL